MSVTDELVRKTQDYARGFDKGDLPMPPGKKIAILACMDARLNPYGLFGLREGDAHVIRNAGGVVTTSASWTSSPAWTRPTKPYRGWCSAKR